MRTYTYTLARTHRHAHINTNTHTHIRTSIQRTFSEKKKYSDMIQPGNT